MIAKWSQSERPQCTAHSQQCPAKQNNFHELSQIPEFPEMLLCAAAAAAAKLCV